jgi:hypothetical protein
VSRIATDSAGTPFSVARGLQGHAALGRPKTGREASRLDARLDTRSDATAELEVSRRLESGESLLWTGAPRRGLLLRPADAFLIPFSLVWCGFAIFWEASALEINGPPFFAVFGLPFVLVGLYLVVGRFFADARRRARTCYGLTDRRVIIVSGLLSRTTNSLLLENLPEVSVNERADGSGTVTFGRPLPFASWTAGLEWPGMARYQTPSFELIPDAKRVHDRVLEAQRALGGRR